VALPGVHRLKGRRAFDHLYRRGRSHRGTWIQLRWIEGPPALLKRNLQAFPASPWRAAVVVSAKVHKRAVRRNRLRRLLHQHLLASCGADRWPAGRHGVWLLLSLKPGSADAEPAALLGECSQLLRQAGLTP
jgi:ribonuclease P protein component